MIFKKFTFILASVQIFLFNIQAMEDESNFPNKFFIENGYVTKSGRNTKKIDYEEVKTSNQNSINNSSGSNFSDNFKDLIRFHEYLEKNTHSTIELKDFKEDYLNYVFEYVLKLLSNDSSDLYYKVSNKNQSTLSIKDILSDIHALAIFAYDDIKLSEKNFDANAIGTYRHHFCSVFLKSIQKNGFLGFLKIEVSYKNQQLINNGTIESTRPDVYWEDTGHVFDFKFLEAEVKEEQIKKWGLHLPNYKGYSIIGEK